MNSNRYILFKIDWLLVVIFLLLSTGGILSIYSVDYARSSGFSFSSSYVKQLLWLGIALTGGLLVLLLDSRFFHAMAYPLFGFIMVLIAGTAIWGLSIGGTTGWIDLGFFRLQPSEFGKAATALALARFLTTYGVDVSQWRYLMIGLLIILIPVATVLMQADVGTSLIYFAFGMVLFRHGMPSFFLYFPIWLGILFLATLLYNEVNVALVITGLGVLTAMIFKMQTVRVLQIGSIVAISVLFVFVVDFTYENVLQHHHKQRINVLLGTETDLRGAGYNVHQSLVAIGSGGISGQGFLNGTQTQYNFIPEQNTDFIFCAIAEEHGFIGSSILLFLYLVLLLRIIFLSENQKDRFTRAFGYGLASVLFLHFTINLAMTMGLFPVVGIPLPFVSYGGSSLIAFALMLFMFLRMEAQAKEIEY